MSNFKSPFFLASFLVFLLACSEAPTQTAEAEPEKPAEPVTGQKVFYQMYGIARSWAPDVQGLRLESIILSDVESESGSYPAWRAVFVSPSQRQAKTITYSVKEAYGTLHEGIFKGPDEGWSPGGGAKPWALPAFKVDSDAAYKTALGKSADYVKKNPDVPVKMLLEWTDRRPNLVWRVYWGQSVATSGYSVLVDASTGEFAGRIG